MTHDPERLKQINQLLKAAIELDPSEQIRFVTESAGTDTELASEVLSLLAFDAEKTGSIRQSIESVASDLRETEKSTYVGEQVGRYLISSKIAEGGMGTVFKAEHTADDFDQTVAIKLLTRSQLSEDAHRRFIDERRILAGLRHPNIAPLIDGGTLNDGTPFIIMELVDGVPIDEYCTIHALDNDAIISLVRKVCDALQYAHRKLVIHRDIKPSNILVTRDGSPKLLDFGIAKLLDADADVHETRVEQRVLTPMYASPEQLEGVPITTAADVYGIGLLLYRLLTGQMPYVPTGGTPRDLESAILSQSPQRPSSAVVSADASGRGREPSWRRRQQKALRGELDTILLTALQKKPERRYESVAAFADDLKRFQQNMPITARGDSVFYVLRKFIRRHRWPVGAAAAMVAAGIGTVSYYTGQLRIERDVATETASFLSDLFQGSDPYKRNKEGLTVDALVDDGLEQLRKNEELATEVRVRLLSTIAHVKQNLGDIDTANELSEEALALAEEHAGVDSALVLPALSSLIQVRRAQDNDLDAVPIAERMLRIAKNTQGAESPEVAEATHMLAVLAYRMGDIETMGEWAHKTYTLRNQIFEPNHKARSTGANMLGLYYWQADDTVTARKYYEESAAISAAQPERNLMTEANLLHNIGLLYNDGGEYEEAVNRYTESLRLRRQASGPDDPILPMTLYSLAHSQSKLGNKPQAHKTFLEQLPLQAAVAGREKHSVAFALTGHGMLLEEMGALEEANRLLSEADRIFGLLPDKSHPDRSATWIGLARLAAASGDYARAETLVGRAVDLRREKRGDIDQSTLRSRIALGRVVFQSGDLSRAAQLVTAVREALGAQDMSEHPYMAEALAVQGQIAQASSAFEEAANWFGKASAILEKSLPPSHHHLAQYQLWHADALRQAGNIDQAKALDVQWRPVLNSARKSWEEIVEAFPVPALDEFLGPAKSQS